MMWDIILSILGGILGFIIVAVIVFLFSKLQMKAWLYEIENFLDNKVNQIKKVKENGKKEE